MSKKDELREMELGVDLLAIQMKEKLRRKFIEGRSGGLDPDHAVFIVKLLKDHVKRLCSGESQQAIDVCNLAMMLWVQEGKQT